MRSGRFIFPAMRPRSRRPPAPGLRGALPLSGDAGNAPAGAAQRRGGAPTGGTPGAGQEVDPDAALRADGRSAAGPRRDRCRPGARRADAAPVDGGGGVGEDGGGALRDAEGVGGGLSGRFDGTDGDPRRTACGDARSPAHPRAGAVRPAERGDPSRESQALARAPGQRGARAGGRHPRTDRGLGQLRPPRSGA